tara:strand:+ start:638 stop:1093 length:456 start_codon:yes stop_codon:yes gene_type:complete
MTALVDRMKDKYGANIREGGVRDGLCVGGAFCMEFHDDIDWWDIAVANHTTDGDPNEITYGQKRYPYTNTLSRAIRQVFGVEENVSEWYAETMINANDSGDFERAWSVLHELFEEYPICGECGEVRQGDARVEGGMKCGWCAYAGEVWGGQ